MYSLSSFRLRAAEERSSAASRSGGDRGCCGVWLTYLFSHESHGFCGFVAFRCHALSHGVDMGACLCLQFGDLGFQLGDVFPRGLGGLLGVVDAAPEFRLMGRQPRFNRLGCLFLCDSCRLLAGPVLDGKETNQTGDDREEGERQTGERHVHVEVGDPVVHVGEAVASVLVSVLPRDGLFAELLHFVLQLVEIVLCVLQVDLRLRLEGDGVGVRLFLRRCAAWAGESKGKEGGGEEMASGLHRSGACAMVCREHSAGMTGRWGEWLGTRRPFIFRRSG